MLHEGIYSGIFMHKKCIQTGEYMRTTLDIPEDLLTEAMQATQTRTKTMAVVLGLKELIQHHRIEKLRALRGKMDFCIDINASRKRGR
jgi:Arc/MetJ family transcription regulator